MTDQPHDGEGRAGCSVCRRTLPLSRIHSVKTAGGCGTANRCDDCGDREAAEIRAFNLQTREATR